MNERAVLKYIEECTRKYGGVEIRAILNYFPPDEEEGVLRQILNRLCRVGWVRFDGRKYTA